MIGNLNHVAIVVPNLDKAVDTYRYALGAKTSEPKDLPEHGVRVVFVELANTKIELLLPIGVSSPWLNFLNATLMEVCIIFVMRLMIFLPQEIS